MITVACVWVEGNVPYPVDYVERLRSMVYRNLKSRHAFVCLTDRPLCLPHGIGTIKIDRPVGMPGWWSKIELYNPAHELLRGRVMYLDLDVVVMRSLAEIAKFDAPFALVPDAGTFKGRNGLKVVKRYNTSVMVWDERADLARLHRLWNPNAARRLWGDQDFVGETLPSEATMPLEWFPRVSEIDARPEMLGEARVVLCKKPKNEEAARTREWVKENWI